MTVTFFFHSDSLKFQDLIAHPFLVGQCQGKCVAEISLLHGLFMWECIGPVWAFNSCWLANLRVGVLSWVVLVREHWQQPELGSSSWVGAMEGMVTAETTEPSWSSRQGVTA